MFDERQRMFRLLNEIYSVIRNYSTRTYSLPFVCKKVIRYMKDGGSMAEITDDKHRDWKVICVDGHRFKILRYVGWSKYDVLPLD